MTDHVSTAKDADHLAMTTKGRQSRKWHRKAQIHATLAVAEQLRIANLITLASLPEFNGHEEVRDLLRGEALHVLARWERISPDDEMPVIVPEIKEALGL